jgi:FixJ family two-component response regulator
MDSSQTLAVLVVDDDSVVRQALAAMLAYRGYEPLPVADGDEAVAVCRARPGGVAAAVLDVRMPGMDGPATLDALQELVPGLPCIFVSGHTGDYSETDLLARGGAVVLDKPVALAQLGDAVAAAISRGSCTGSAPRVE